MKKMNLLALKPMSVLTSFLAVTQLVSHQASAHAEKTGTKPTGNLELVHHGENSLLTGVRQLTFAGSKAGEGYFSRDGKQMIYQSDRKGDNPFYQIYVMDLATGTSRQLSPGRGKTTCAWIHPSSTKALFSSTHLDPDAKKKEEMELKERNSPTKSKYSWSYDEHYDIFEAPIKGASNDPKKLKRLTTEKGYDAEGSYSPDGKYIAFASNRAAYSGQMSEEDAKAFHQDQSYMMDIYIMNADGTNVKQLTTSKGYDGGPFFSADGKKITWRRFTPDGQIAEIYTMNVDGSDQKPVTQLRAMSWAPYFHPSGDYIIFTTNIHGYENFELYIVDSQGKQKPVRVTFADGFDGLPVFSPDGKQVSWTKRAANGDSQIYIGQWDDAQARRLLHLSEPAPPVKSLSPEITEADAKAHVEHLASAVMGGRKTGSEQETIYTEFIANLFKSFGLKPAHGDSFFQKFEFTSGVKLGAKNELRLSGSGASTPLAIEKDWVPLSFSNKGPIEEAGIVFAGYGIVAPASATASAYDSYKDLDVKGKWVVVFRDIPTDLSGPARQNLHIYSRPQHKATVARQRGAIGVILVNGPNYPSKTSPTQLKYEGSLSGSSLAIVSVTDEAASRILASAKKTLKELQDDLDKGAFVPGFEIPGTQLAANIDLDEQKSIGTNVIAALKVPHAKKSILIGAHGDHLGTGETGNSLATGNEKGHIHYGADDNASGMTAVLELAHHFAQPKNRARLKQNLEFAIWSGEEIGVLGSAHYAKTVLKAGAPTQVSQAAATAPPPGGASPHGASPHGASPHGTVASEPKRDLPLSASVNLDMIGRLREQLYVQGVGSATEWKELLEGLAPRVPFAMVTQEDPYLPTDAVSTYLAGVPSISLFTGAHSEYHTPRDVAELVNYKGLADITKSAALLIEQLAKSPQPALTYRKVEGSRKNLGEGRSFRIYLGTVPDYSQEGVKGVRISGASKDSPAEVSQLLAGDIIVELDKNKIENLYDYVYALQSMKPGAPVPIIIMRGGKRMELRITPRLKD